jgi:Flp pilus assembly CpaE family ATPase
MKPEHEKTVVLLVEDRLGEAEFFRQTLAAAEGSGFQVECAERLSEALARARQGDIDVVLLELSLPDSSGLETFLKMQAAAPQLPVVILADAAGEKLAFSALRQGAQDYLLKGRGPASLIVRSLRNAIERHRSVVQAPPGRSRGARQAGRVVAFLGAKGGVGATTVALNVATVLAGRHSVVAVELRGGFGAFAPHLGQREPVENLGSLWALDPDQLDERDLARRLVSLPSGLRVMFGPQRASECREVTSGHAAALIHRLADLAECQVLDLPAFPCAANRAAARCSQLLALVVEREPGAVLAAGQMLELLRSWNATQGLIGVVIVNRTPLAAPMPLHEITAQLGSALLGVIPPAPDLCAKALHAGTLAVLLEPDSMLAGSFRALAEKLEPAAMLAPPRP